MRCLECGEREAAVIWIDLTRPYRDVRHDGEPEESAIDAPPIDSTEQGAQTDAAPRGPTICEECARTRYDARRPPQTPTWEEFTRHLPE